MLELSVVDLDKRSDSLASDERATDALDNSFPGSLALRGP